MIEDSTLPTRVQDLLMFYSLKERIESVPRRYESGCAAV